MARKEIIWSVTAENQLAHVLEFWVEHNQSKSYSIKLLDIVYKAVQLIQTYPKANEKLGDFDARTYVLGNYSLIYQERETVILLLAFWDNRQDPDKLLELMMR